MKDAGKDGVLGLDGARETVLAGRIRERGPSGQERPALREPGHVKRCSQCGEVKPLSAFYTNGRYMRSNCKACKIRSNGLYAEANRDKVRLRKQRWRQSAAGRAELQRETERTRLKREADPQRRKAHSAVHDAVATGRLVPPAACVRCSSERFLVAHHADYAKPLEVEWLCRRCHALEHGRVEEVAS